jgi:hypothetical protein
LRKKYPASIGALRGLSGADRGDQALSGVVGEAAVDDSQGFADGAGLRVLFHALCRDSEWGFVAAVAGSLRGDWQVPHDSPPPGPHGQPPHTIGLCGDAVSAAPGDGDQDRFSVWLDHVHHARVHHHLSEFVVDHGFSVLRVR